MRSTINKARQSQNTLSLAIVSCLLTLSVSYANLEEQTEEGSETRKSHFTRLDTMEAINNYRDERHREIAENLALSKLSDENQELIANAITEMYLGVPVSSFTHTEREESSSEEPFESSARWIIGDDGRIQHSSLSIVYSLDSASPFVSLSPLPFDASTGRVLSESDSDVRFVFDLNKSVDLDIDESLSGLAAKMKWVAEFSIGKHDRSPMGLVLRLEKPVRQRFLFKLSTFKMELRYSYIDDCSGYAVNTMTMEVDGSVIVAGKIYLFAESLFSDIACEQPIVRLLPQKTESDLFEF